ncbi:phage head-tail connector protein [Limosilactobacillus fermentum]
MSRQDMLSKVKTLIGLDDDSQDTLLGVIIDTTDQALCFKLQEDTVPTELSYIEQEVSIRRFNRIKNEGMASYTQEGESITFNSNDFDDFLDDINEWRRRHNKDVKILGNISFINPYWGDDHEI